MAQEAEKTVPAQANGQNEPAAVGQGEPVGEPDFLTKEKQDKKPSQ